MTGLPDTTLQAILAEQDAYRRAPPSAVPRLVRGFARPVSALTHRLIPPEAIEAALVGADWVASATIRQAAISHDFADLAACEAAALMVRRWAIGYAATGGGAAGAFGAFGLADGRFPRRYTPWALRHRRGSPGMFPTGVRAAAR